MGFSGMGDSFFIFFLKSANKMVTLLGQQHTLFGRHSADGFRRLALHPDAHAVLSPLGERAESGGVLLFPFQVGCDILR